MRVQGFRLGTIRLSLPPATSGIIWKEALEMAGFDEHPGTLDTVPDKLWRTLVADRGPNGTLVPSWYHRACLYCLEHATSIGNGDINTTALLEASTSSIMTEFLQGVQSVIWNRKFFDSNHGDYFDIGPSQLTKGDVVCIRSYFVPDSSQPTKGGNLRSSANAIFMA